MLNIKDNKNLSQYVVLGVLGFIAVYIALFREQHLGQSKKATPTNETQASSPADADTFIPAGHVLVPIEIENSKALSGLVRAFAVVDLYSRNELGSWVKLAEKVKLIRAPLDPSQFAVLLPDPEAQKILQLNHSFWVSLQNRSAVKAQTEVQKIINKEGNELPAQTKLIQPKPKKTRTKKMKNPNLHRKIFEIEYQI